MNRFLKLALLRDQLRTLQLRFLLEKNPVKGGKLLIEINHVKEEISLREMLNEIMGISKTN